MTGMNNILKYYTSYGKYLIFVTLRTFSMSSDRFKVRAYSSAQG